jgi:hypothetical protein
VDDDHETEDIEVRCFHGMLLHATATGLSDLKEYDCEDAPILRNLKAQGLASIWLTPSELKNVQDLTTKLNELGGGHIQLIFIEFHHKKAVKLLQQDVNTAIHQEIGEEIAAGTPFAKVLPFVAAESALEYSAQKFKSASQDDANLHKKTSRPVFMNADDIMATAVVRCLFLIFMMQLG